jgi:thioredoxin-like negative regulator of GroEL
MMMPVLEEVAGQVKVLKINTDEEPELAAAFQVESIPMLVVVQGGRVVDGFVGAAPAKAIMAMIEKATLPAATR